MRSALLSLGLAAFAVAAPRPQDLDFEAIEAAPDPALMGPPVELAAQEVVYDPAAASASATAEVTTLPTVLARRDVVVKRGVNDPCAPQPDG